MKPNFSGTWSFNRYKSVLQIEPPDATLFLIDHRDPNFRITRTHTIGARKDTFSLDLTTNGEPLSAEREGLQLRARAYWEGDTLVFETNLVRAGEEGTNVVRYTLADNQQAFVAEERFRSASLNYDNVWWLDKVEGARQ